MKKIIFIMLVLSSFVFAQATWTKYDKIEGRNTKQVKGDTSAVMVYTMNPSIAISLTQALIDSLQKVSLFPNGQTYANVRDSWQWARIRTVFADSVRTDSVAVVRSRDTVSITATEWAKVTMHVAAGDSVSFAIGTTAPSNYWEWQTIRNGETFVSEKLNYVYFTKVFIKGAGYPDHIESYQCIIEAF